MCLLVCWLSVPSSERALEGRRHCDITDDRLTAPPAGPHQNDNVIKAILFTLLLLINDVDDGVNKGY